MDEATLKIRLPKLRWTLSDLRWRTPLRPKNRVTASVSINIEGFSPELFHRKQVYLLERVLMRTNRVVTPMWHISTSNESIFITCAAEY